MNTFLRNIFYLIISLTIISCIASTKPQFSHEIEQPDANFVLYVSNQSYDKPKVDISVSIDEEPLFSDTFRVKNQHHWKMYSIKLEAGFHTINAMTEKGACLLEQKFEITQKHWAVLSFWYNKDNSKKVQQPKFTLEISERPYGFL